jgi:hypothetical protein
LNRCSVSGRLVTCMPGNRHLLALAGALAAVTTATGLALRDTDSPDLRVDRVESKRSSERSEAERERWRRDHPRLPNVVGSSPTDAREALIRRGVPARFSGHTCSDVSPGGDVVSQSPSAGERFVAVRRAHLWTDMVATCSPRTAPRACVVSDVWFRARGQVNDLGGGSSVRSVAVLNVEHRGEHACQLNGTVRATLRTVRTGYDEPVRGNPATLLIRRRLAPGRPLRVWWDWSNSCGIKGKVRAVIELAGMTDQAPIPRPLCERGREPSTFRMDWVLESSR